MAKIEIILDKTDANYRTGETITGKAALTLDKQVKCRSVKAKLLGKEWTMFTRGAGKNQHTYYQENKFLESEAVLKNEGNLQPGTFEFPLTFILPPQAPSSYNGACAHIEYTLTAWADIPMWFDIKKEQALSVAGNLPQANNPTLAISSTTNPPKPSFTISLKESRFKAGQNVEGTLTASNLQNSRAKQAVIKLLAIEDAAADQLLGTVHEKTTIRKAEIAIPASEIAYGAPRTFSIPIPAGSPPSFASKLSSVEWVIEASLDIPLWFDITAKGTIAVYPQEGLQPTPEE